MNYADAARILGPDGVRRAEEFVAALPPLSAEKVEEVAQIMHNATGETASEAPQPPAAEHDVA